MKPNTSANMSANTMTWLLRREFWEHKGSMFWAPVVVGALLVVLMGGILAYVITVHGYPEKLTMNFHPDGVPVHKAIMAAGMLATGAYMSASAPLFAILTGVVFFYCLGALYDERRDRSILFWKSLPVSDPMTVLSKAITAMVVAPVITIALIVAVALALILIACVALGTHGQDISAKLLTSPELYLSPLRAAALLPVYVVWALPTVGWLLLVSSWAKSKPLLWAVGIPVVALVVIKWINAALENFAGQTLLLAHYANDVVVRILGGIVPGIWFTFPGNAPNAMYPTMHPINAGGVLTISYRSLAGIDAWIGVAMGIAMLYAAMRMRRWRDEG